MRLEPKGVVVVGQPVTLSVDVLVPTWFTRAPVYPALEIPGAIAVLSDARPVNLSERIAGDGGVIPYLGLARRIPKRLALVEGKLMERKEHRK